MKSLLSVILLILALSSAGSLYAQGEGFGAGVILGEPTGISLKNWFGRKTAFDVGLAWSFQENGDFHLHADYLWHDFGVFKVRTGRLPLYYGIGGRIKFSDKTRMGVRGVIGLDYLFKNAPFDIFLEVAPILDIVPKTELFFNGALGFRFFL